jgi:hypothetical protein
VRIVRLVRMFSGTLSAHSALSAHVFRRDLTTHTTLIKLCLRLGLPPLRLLSNPLLVSEQSRGRCKLELFAEALSAITAVVLTVACGLLCEELLFGGLVRLFFPPRPAHKTAGSRCGLLPKRSRLWSGMHGRATSANYVMSSKGFSCWPKGK